MSVKTSDVEGAGITSKQGSAWISARTSERVVAQQAFASDPKFRKYTQQVERCLNSFDNVHEWADCIAFLKQLLKTFQSYMQFKEIPRKLVVAKRLAQCLNPALPAGVHQRALDVYSHILAVLGSEGLKRDLALWSSGLFPFFEYSSTSVKPALLNLYDTHYMPLQAGLRPITKSFILALLPGLEEETGEFFDKVLSLLDRLSGTVSPTFFLQNIWLVMLTTPSARGTSLNYLSRRLPKMKADEDFSGIVGRDIGLMIRAFSIALEDENLLVRRGALDLLIQSLRIDSISVKTARAEDRTILMRAATGVVLRRDLSLNRRLYTWLLGSDEKSDKQIAHLQEHSLDLLKVTLKDEMFRPSAEYSESRPFKIFISLLDKWEIGAALTNALVIDAFRAIKNLIETHSESAGDISVTANTLYEAVEPQIVWKQLLTNIALELTGESNKYEAIHIARFILRTFPSHDEEIQSIHLPIVFSAIVDVLNLRSQNDLFGPNLPAIREGLLLLDDLSAHFPPSAFMQRPELTGDLQAASASQSPYRFACMFYSITPIAALPPQTGSFTIPLKSVFENFVALSMRSARGLNEGPAGQEVFSLSVLLLERLVAGLNSSVAFSWHPLNWLSTILETLDYEKCLFVTADRVISLVVALHQNQHLEPWPSIDTRPVMSKLVNKLLKYLRPEWAVYHVRSVTLIWSLEAATKQPHVESILAQNMASTDLLDAHEPFLVFGTLWRLTEDNLLPGFRLQVPVMLVLDTLKSEDPRLRRIGETWMRCSLKSYLRVLDPILYDLLEPSIRRRTTVANIRGKELQAFSYERPYDQRYVNHLLETVLSVVRFGGQGFAKATRSTPVRRSHHTGLVQRIESSFPDPDASYLDVLVELLVRFLQSEPADTNDAALRPLNAVTQSVAVDLLQAIIARGEIDSISVETVEAAVVGKLFFCVHTRRLDLQNKLLHLLHSIISASTSIQDSPMSKTPDGKDRIVDTLSQSTLTIDNTQALETRSYSVNPLLTQTLVDGISVPSNRPVLQHWLDFILMAIPQFQPTLHVVVAPLNECICRQLVLAMTDIVQASSKDCADQDIPSAVTDTELITLLGGLERMVLLNLAHSGESNPFEEESSVPEKSGQESGGLLGYVSNVFSSESMQNATEDYIPARSSGYRSLRDGVRVLFAIWTRLVWSKPSTWSPKDDSLSFIYTRTRLRCRRVLEHLYHVQSPEVLESIVECWSRDKKDPKIDSAEAFELTDILIANAQDAVHMICESISSRVSSSTERNKKQALNPHLSEAVLFQFLEKYMHRLENPLALQVWGRFLQLVKEILGNTKEYKVQNFLVFRCFCVLADKITQTTAIEDRRFRREVQENFGKLLDACIVIAGRTSDSGSWIRRGIKEVNTSSGRESPAPRSDLKIDAKLNRSSASLPESSNMPVIDGESTLEISQISAFIATTAVPNLRKFLMDNDKVVAACANIIYYIVNPALKGKSRPLDVDSVVVDIIKEMSRFPGALKSWRTPVTELLNDNRLFNDNPEAAERWKPVVKALFDADKTAFPELLAKVATAPSANIFTNREYEMLLRSLNLRRLSFVILTGDRNHFITLLPTIQEKLVDVWRNVTAPIVQSEVYLCIRVLLCRISAHNLTSFWPVILTEMYRVFEQVMTSPPSDGSEDLQLVLSASKCLDLLLALQTEEFQIHQWIFITDTVDAVYRPDNWFPEAMMDQLAEIASSIPAGPGTPSNGDLDITTPTPTFAEQRPMRRPMLNSLRQIDSIRDLVPFFSHISIASYESVYASFGNIDWDVVEKGIMDDMFDGR